MKRKILLISLSLIIIISFLIFAIVYNNINNDSMKFKNDYESINEKSNSGGIAYRNVSIDKNNPFVYVEANDLLNMMDNKESFYVYFGSKYCPWCRSVIEMAINVAKEKGIKKIYYVDIWDEDRNEILRDKYVLNSNNEPEQVIEGTEVYYELLNRFDNVLYDYVLRDEDGNKINVGEKRISAPNFIYIKDGIANSLVTGISEKQKNFNDDLSSEILDDEHEIFNNYYLIDLVKYTKF